MEYGIVILLGVTILFGFGVIAGAMRDDKKRNPEKWTGKPFEW